MHKKCDSNKLQEIETKIVKLGIICWQTNKSVYIGINHGYRKHCQTSWH